jgi:TetR/AcrR family transcriptional regulator, transcriptional repressor for nem operon
MMPWSKSRKESTRQKIVDAAGAAFRARGAGGAGLADVMQEAGLTHGGFYAHFKSKDELIAAALKAINTARLARFKDAAAGSEDGTALSTAVDLYLTSRHREHPESGCAIAALGSELAREDGAARHQMSKNVQAWLELFAQSAPGSNAKVKMRQATATFAAMIGGMIMARAVEDPHQADRILADVRAFLQDS